MVNFLLIGVCLLAGIWFRQSGRLAPNSAKGINSWIIYFALPAVSFKYLPYISWNKSLLLPALAPVIIWLFGWLYARVFSNVSRLSRPSEGALKLSVGLSNTSFVGFPLVAAYFSDKALAIAVICDQVTFLLLATAGIIVAVNASGKHELSPGVIIKRVLKFPPFWGCLLALVLPRFIDLGFLSPFFDKLAAAVAPLALFSVGLQLQFKGWKKELRSITIGLLYKLFLAPLLVLLLVLALGAKGIIPSISIFEVAMPTLVTSGVVAGEYELDTQLSGLIIGVGIIISFATTAGWWWLLHHIIGG